MAKRSPTLTDDVSTDWRVADENRTLATRECASGTGERGGVEAATESAADTLVAEDGIADVRLSRPLRAAATAPPPEASSTLPCSASPRVGTELALAVADAVIMPGSSEEDCRCLGLMGSVATPTEMPRAARTNATIRFCSFRTIARRTLSHEANSSPLSQPTMSCLSGVAIQARNGRTVVASPPKAAALAEAVATTLEDNVEIDDFSTAIPEARSSRGTARRSSSEKSNVGSAGRPSADGGAAKAASRCRPLSTQTCAKK